MIDGTLQLALGGVISSLLLYQGIVIRQFAKSVERLEKHMESLSQKTAENGERLARLEARMG